jgi:hypothetical protein
VVTYYVASAAHGGSDSNSGTSTGSPWATVAKVNAATLTAGSSVFFNGGDTWTGTALAPTANGTSGSPITFSSYGTGHATIANTAAGNSIYLNGVGGYVISNLILTGPGGATAGAGVWFESTMGTQLAPVTITGCTASNYSVGLLGIADAAGDGFSALTITNNTLTGNVYQGLSVSGPTPTPGTPIYNFPSVTISGNTVYNNLGSTSVTVTSTGYGMFLGNFTGGTVSGNMIYGNGSQNGGTGGGPSGICLGFSTGTVVSGNTVYNQATGTGSAQQDGEGIDLDLECVNCVVEYNIVYGCQAAGLFAFSDDAYWSGNVYRYNMLWGNAQGYAAGAFGEITLFTGGAGQNLTNLAIYGNTIVSRDNGTIHPPPILINVAGTLSGCTIRNNVLYAQTGPTIVVDQNWATSALFFQGNCYYGTGTFGLTWNATTYPSLTAWRTATSQEIYSATNVGMQSNPLLVAPATTPAVTNPSNLAPADGLMLGTGSPATAAGLPLNADFGTVIGTQDFFGIALTLPQMIGAAQPSGAPAAAAQRPAVVMGRRTAPRRSVVGNNLQCGDGQRGPANGLPVIIYYSMRMMP